MAEIKSILIIGIAGGLAQLTAKLLKERYPDAQILGVDSRKISKIKDLKGVLCKEIRYQRNDFEKLFRSRKFDTVYHLGRLSHATLSPSLTFEKRLEFNLIETKRILELCLERGVLKVVVLSTFHVYGAYPDNSVFLDEESPLRASIHFPALRDVVEMDYTATNWMWKNQNKIETVVLRPCNIIGPRIKNVMTRYLSNPHSPYPIDYNPSFQFIHEEDMASVLVQVLEKIPTGVYNVAPGDLVTLKEALKICGNRGFPFPLFLMTPLAKIIRSLTSVFPDYLIEYLKYSCLIDNILLTTHLGKNFVKFSIEEALKGLSDKR